jgi:AcrR family transcriptional regulator
MAGSPERAALLSAAHRHLARGGSGVSVEDVLRGAGVNRRIFYRHFSSKDDLLLALQEETGRRLLASLRSAVEAASSPLEAVIAWGRAFLAVAWDERRAAQGRVFLATESAAAPGLADAREDIHAEHRALLAGVLDRGRVDGSLPRTVPERDAFALHAMVLRHVETRVRGRRSYTFAQACDDFTALLEPMLLGPPRAAASSAR